jgi:hypothetical protein
MEGGSRLTDHVTKTPGRNDPCPCGSGRKYKQCCLAKDEAASREARAKALAEAPAPVAEETKPSKGASRHQTHQPWRGNLQNTRGFQKVSAPRKVGQG